MQQPDHLLSFVRPKNPLLHLGIKGPFVHPKLCSDLPLRHSPLSNHTSKLQRIHFFSLPSRVTFEVTVIIYPFL